MNDERRRKASCDMSDEEGCKWADHAADKAVSKTFAIMGVDVNEPESVEEFREDLRFGKHMRKLTNHGISAAVVLIVAGVIATLWIGIKERLGTP